MGPALREMLTRGQTAHVGRSSSQRSQLRSSSQSRPLLPLPLPFGLMGHSHLAIGHRLDLVFVGVGERGRQMVEADLCTSALNGNT